MVKAPTLIIFFLGTNFFLCLPSVKAQFIRQVVVYQDTVIEFQKHGADDPNIDYGVDIRMWDSTGKTIVLQMMTQKNNLRHGHEYLFDPITGLPILKEHYVNGLQDGLSYYWNKRGELIRTERWKKGKLISKQIFRKS